jgi:O-antigen/teichoic acid export membrane protein
LSNTSKFASGLSWNTLTVVIQVVIQLLYTGIFARLVTPDAFMLMGLVLGIMGFAEIFSQVGVGPALVQRKEIHQQHINGAFFTALLLGLLFTLGFILSAPSIAHFYQLPELETITQMVCTSFTISALGVVPRNLMMKEMRFKAMFKAGMISIIGGNLVVGLSLAYLGFGVWAYVWALFAQNTLMTLSLWYFQPVRITPSWQWRYTAELMRYGVGSTLFNSLNYLATKMDVLVIPKSLSIQGAELTLAQKTSAANYERANYAMSQPITIMGKLSDSVLFSGMSAMQDNLTQLRRTFLIATNLIGLVMWPAAGFIFFFAKPLILLWLGHQYLEAASILQVLFLVAVLRTLSKLCDSLLRAKDHLMKGSIIKIIYVVLIVSAILIAVPYGMRMVAIGVVCANALHYLLNAALSARILSLSPTQIARAWVPSILVGTVSFLLAGAVHFALRQSIDSLLLQLSLGAVLWIIGLGACVYRWPWIMGGPHQNPLHVLPSKLKSIFIVQQMIRRLQKEV